MAATRDESRESELQDLVAQVDTGGRQPEGLPRRVLYLVALSWSLFQLWIASPLPFVLHFGIFPDTQARSIHLAFAVFLAYTSYPALLATAHRPLRIAGWSYAAGALASLIFAGLVATGSASGPPPVVLLAIAGTLAVASWSALFPTPRTRVPKVDWVLALVAAFAALYLYIFYVELAGRPGRPTALDLVASGVGMIALLEATRRTLGPALMIIALVFLVYTFLGPHMPDLIAHRGASFSRAASQFWLSAEGVFGIALGVSTSFVFLFVLFGAMLDKAGAGNYFIQVAFSLLGHLRGGPAKAAVVASAMTGVISGSSIANTVTTGTFTIPLMKRVGFSAEKAGAVEVASSVNGQLMPPVMGAAAFLMVEYVGISYIEVIKHAFLPAVISYIALVYIVHLEALKAGMEGIPPKVVTPTTQKLFYFAIVLLSVIILAGLVYYAIGWVQAVAGPAASWIIGAGVFVAYLGLLWNAARYPELELDDPDQPVFELPEPRATIHSGLHYVLPIVVLVWALVVERLSPGLSAFYAVTFMIFILLTQRPLMVFFRGRQGYWRETVRGAVDLVEGMVAGARNMVGIGVATATAGIIVGVVALTGIGFVLTQLVEVISGGNLILMLLFVAMLSLVLGLGLPTTANYIIVATLMAPVVVELGAQAGLIVPLIAVHLFVFYFGIMADVTPPVGLASFAAAAVSRGDPIRTGLQAFYYSLRTVALPFIFIFNTQLLLIGIGSWWELVLTFASATVAMLVFAAATQGHFLVRTRWYEVIALLLVAFSLFRPGYWWDQIYPEFDQRPGSELLAVIEEKGPNEHIRFFVEGMDMEGREVYKAVMLPLGDDGRPEARLAEAGVMVMPLGEEMQISTVSYGSVADRFGLNMGLQITAVLVPADRSPRQLVFIPALALLALIVFLQQRRRRAETPMARAAHPEAG